MEMAKSYSVRTPVLTAAATCCAHRGDPRRAAILFGAADSTSMGDPPGWITRMIEDARAIVRADLPEGDLVILEAQGAAMSAAEASAYVVSLVLHDAHA
jgi:hypothetical protein